MRFNYQARTKRGQIQAGQVEAGSYEAAVKTLQRHGLLVVYLESISAIPFFARTFTFLQRVKTKEVVMFYRQLAILLEAGVPVVACLRALTEQTTNPYFKNIVFEVEADVRGGTSVSQALAKHKKVFSSFYINVIKSGEAAGRLAEILGYLADHAEEEYNLNRKIRGAMIYPAAILSLFIVIGILMMIYVMPQLTSVLQELGQELPLPTRVLIATSNFVGTWILLLIVILIILVLVVWRFIKTPEGRAVWDRLKLKIPILGNLFRKIYLARFSENLSTLIKGGLSILASLKITGDVIGNTVFKNLIDRAGEEVKGGGSISSVFKKSKEVPPMVSQMIAVGEKTARTSEILKRVADFYRSEVDTVVSNLTQLIEPILIVVLGLGVGILISSILLPIYRLAGGL